MQVKRIIIHPSNNVASAASFTHDVEAMREPELKQFLKRLRDFFKSFESLNFRDLSFNHIQTLVNQHGLDVQTLLANSTKKLRNLR
ncbi:hypothetical protein D3C85_1561540 [compost metagenome]